MSSDRHPPLEPSDLTWMGSDRALARTVARPLARFLRIEAASGVLLIVATVAALVWVNSPWKESYHELWHSHIDIHIGSLLTLSEPLEAWVNDALMAIFFFVVGLEIKRELVVGQLRDRREAMVPAVAALGGMIVPALIYFALNTSGDGASGWGIPMATDIAFAVGVVSLLGNRVSSQLKIFLLTLAVVDDIGAILVIAIFYSSDLSFGWLAIAGATVALVLIMRQVKIWYVPLYVLVGTFLWLAVFESGVHATIAGVVLGLITPARPLQRAIPPEEVIGTFLEPGQLSIAEIQRAKFEMQETVSVAERLETVLQPFASYIIIPIFALANAGIEISGESIREAAGSSITHGVVLGLVLGKTIGVTLFTLALVKFGFGRLPGGARPAQILGIAAVSGIGFTVSLFVAGLAFDGPAGAVFVADAKIGILTASIVAAILGAVVLVLAAPSDGDEDENSPASFAD